jgi:hypothetical protein
MLSSPPRKRGSRIHRCGLAAPGFPLFAGMTTRIGNLLNFIRFSDAKDRQLLVSWVSLDIAELGRGRLA